MAIQIQGNAGVTAEVDENRNLNIQGDVIPGYPTAGGFYVAAGFTTAVVAATLASSTLLMSARLSASSTRKAYVTKFRVTMSTATPGASGGIPTMLGIVRFTAVTPTGGTSRTAARIGPAKGSASDVTDIRDANVALTGSPTFGDLMGVATVPNNGTDSGVYEWVFEPVAPIELAAGDGLALRTQNTGPGTATWNYSYGLHWFER